jgi:hypothetical protein
MSVSFDCASNNAARRDLYRNQIVVIDRQIDVTSTAAV